MPPRRFSGSRRSAMRSRCSSLNAKRASPGCSVRSPTRATVSAGSRRRWASSSRGDSESCSGRLRRPTRGAKRPPVTAAAEFPPALGLRHVALRVRDLEAAERFFVELLGYRVEWRPDADDVYLIREGDNVALHRVAGEPGAGMLDHVGLLVARPGDVDRWADHLQARGATVRAQPRTHRDGARSLYL